MYRINHSQNPVSISSFASFSWLAFLSSNSSNDTIDNPATFRFKLYRCQSPTKIWHYKELLTLIDCSCHLTFEMCSMGFCIRKSHLTRDARPIHFKISAKINNSLNIRIKLKIMSVWTGEVTIDCLEWIHIVDIRQG